MITQISTKNLKSLLNFDFQCKNLNLITGTNSSGKSTFIQSILLAKQNSPLTVGLNGFFVNLGERNPCVEPSETNRTRSMLRCFHHHLSKDTPTSAGRGRNCVSGNPQIPLRSPLC